MVSSLYGAPTPAVGTQWYNEGQLINASVTSSVPGGVGTQFVCTGWAGTGSAPTLGSSNSIAFNLTNNTTLSFVKEISGNWYWGDKTIYWLAEVMDGENLVYKQEECTLTKVCL